MGGLVPIGNPDSLWAYYLGIFSIFPAFGLIMGAIAVVKGSRALRYAKANPESKGKAHAFVGIGCGTIGFLFNLSVVLFILYLVYNNPRRSN